MGKLLVVLVSVAILLNGLTFLMVVGTEPAEKAVEKPSPTTRAAVPAALTQQLARLEKTVQRVSSDLSRVRVQISGLEKKIVASRATRRTLPSTPPPANTGDRRFEYSQSPAESDGTPPADVEEEAERDPAEDEETVVEETKEPGVEETADEG